MECAAEVTQNQQLLSGISLSDDGAVEEQLVEQALRRRGHELVEGCGHEAGSGVVSAKQGFSAVDLGPHDVEVAGQDDLLAHGDQVADAGIQGVQEAEADTTVEATVEDIAAVEILQWSRQEPVEVAVKQQSGQRPRVLLQST